MRKIFKKALASMTTLALVATLFVGVNATSPVKAEETTLTLNNWTFTRGGVDYNAEYANGNEGRINSVTMNGTNEVISGWLTLSPAEQKQSATQLSTGFSMNIANTGWDKDWKNDTINPWQIQAQMNNVAIKAGHIYTVSFKASASKKKYAYIAFSSEIEGAAPYGEDAPTGSTTTIAITTTEQEFTYTFTNWVEVETFSTAIFLGDFASDSKKDYAGNDISGVMTENETGWSGIVNIKDFTITDKGLNPDYEPTPERPTVAPPTVAPETQAPTQAPTVQNPTTQAPVVQTPAPTVKKLAKVKKVKAKNIGKGKVKITWKKVKNAKKYQVKVGTKKYTTKKAKLVVKKLKKGKKYTVRVRAMKRTGFKAGAWSKKVKVKVTK